MDGWMDGYRVTSLNETNYTLPLTAITQAYRRAFEVSITGQFSHTPIEMISSLLETMNTVNVFKLC